MYPGEIHKVFDFGTDGDLVLKFLVYPLLFNISVSKLYEFIPSLVEICDVCISGVMIHCILSPFDKCYSRSGSSAITNFVPTC
jgi:hypothetical protein